MNWPAADAPCAKLDPNSPLHLVSGSRLPLVLMKGAILCRVFQVCAVRLVEEECDWVYMTDYK